MRQKILVAIFVSVFISFVLLMAWIAISEIHRTKETINRLQQAADWSAPSSPLEIEHTDGLNMIWNVSPIYSRYKQTDSFLTAQNGRLFLLASVDPQEDQKLLMMDAKSGEVLWELTDDPMFTDFAVDENMLYAGNSIGVVKRFNSTDQSLSWSTDVGNVKGPCCFQVNNGALYSLWLPRSFTALSIIDGSIQIKNDGWSSEVLLKVDGDTIYYNVGMSNLTAAKRFAGKNEMLWEVELEREDRQVPVISQGIIFIRDGRRQGSVYAINQESGKVLWQTNPDVVSNLAASNEAIFFITKGGELVGLDLQTGNRVFGVKFSIDTLPMEAIRLEPGYEVAFDASMNNVFALFGDSAQLFAFEILK